MTQPYACRFCRHATTEHGDMVGCRHCTCLATPGEATPTTAYGFGLTVLPPSMTMMPRTEVPTYTDDEPRYWLMHPSAEGLPWGSSTYAVVDDEQGIIAYCHRDSGDTIVDALNATVTRVTHHEVWEEGYAAGENDTVAFENGANEGVTPNPYPKEKP